MNVTGDLTIEAESIDMHEREPRASARSPIRSTSTPFLEALEDFLAGLDIGELIGDSISSSIRARSSRTSRSAQRSC